MEVKREQLGRSRPNPAGLPRPPARAATCCAATWRARPSSSTSRQRADHDRRQGGRVGPRQLLLPAHVRPGLLRDGVDARRRRRVDLARFGWEAFRASPRQADLIILSGRVSVKMAPVVRRIWDQMLEPKYAISMGACCSSTGVFNNYALVASDKFMPIDVHVPGLPAAPGGGRPRHHPPAREDPVPPTSRLARALRRARDRGDPHAGGIARRAPPTGRSTCSREATPPVPDATGLELIAHELRDANAEAISAPITRTSAPCCSPTPEHIPRSSRR